MEAVFDFPPPTCTFVVQNLFTVASCSGQLHWTRVAIQVYISLSQGGVDQVSEFLVFLCVFASLLFQSHWAFTKDFLQHAKIADRLLGHYCQQWKNRECYWLARTRAQQVGDLCCMMIDSYDKAKCMLPKYPRGRTPKQVIYEQVKRTFLEISDVLSCHGWMYFLNSGYFLNNAS